ncbi:translation elongation factor G [Flexistipes sinusarabici DSM 4947]|uniref:Elongation factor G n=3 Tax=Flexistipes sinusarabici TaxID=2352 RepID=F8E663_FLESM|nr:elongation factor G [Flexistipes sinusarabici]AEI14771.1 translation elongation factor G [Flexistipes sinusarabici DSM 4947]
MQVDEVKNIRNVAFISHGGAGKTSLIEAILFNAKATKRIGSVDNGTSIMDFDPVEINRKITINPKLCSIEWNKHLLNLVDTPGYGNFLHETKSALSAVGGAVVIASAISGIKAETERVWNFADDFDLAKIIFVNKMDKERADFYRTLGDIEQSFGITPIPLYLPIGKEESFRGIVDLIKQKAYEYPSEPTAEFKEMDIPADMKEAVESQRNKLLEAISETDDELIEKYLEGEEFSEEEILKGIREATITKRFIPVICGSAVKNVGSKFLLESIIDFMPSPLEREQKVAKNKKTGEEVMLDPENKDFVAYVFKTFIDPFSGKLSIFRVYSGEITNDTDVYNASKDEVEKITQLYLLQGKNFVKTDKVVAGQIAMVNKLKFTETFDTLCSNKKESCIIDPVPLAEPVLSFSLVPKSKEDEEKVSTGLHRLMEEDLGIRVTRDEQTGEQILSGMGQMHIEVVTEKLKKKFNVDVDLKTPKVPYKETIKISAKGQGKYKKQSGGRGQYGDVWIEMEPNERGGGIEFIDKIVGGVIPKGYIPAVEKGIREAALEGVLAGYPLIDFKVTLYDGSYHSVDSSEMAFKIAASMAFKKVAMEAKPVLLEPIVNMDIFVPEETVGTVIGDLNSRRGRVQNVEPQTTGQHITAQVPMGEILKYAPDLRSMTGGRGMFTIEFSHYEEAPSHVVEKVKEQSKVEQQ